MILDWYISLYDKDRMSSCTVTYSPTIITQFTSNATGDVAEVEEDTVVLDFLPRRRTFLLQSLSPNTTYQFVMECADSVGRNYATKPITFKTGAVKTRSCVWPTCPQYKCGVQRHCCRHRSYRSIDPSFSDVGGTSTSQDYLTANNVTGVGNPFIDAVKYAEAGGGGSGGKKGGGSRRHSMSDRRRPSSSPSSSSSLPRNSAKLSPHAVLGESRRRCHVKE